MYAVIDTETTGFRPGDDRILELAIVGLDQAGKVEWEWCTLLNPGRPTHNRATAIHQIYDSDLAGAHPFDAYAGYVSTLLTGRAIIGHNVSFDLGFLSAEYELIGARSPHDVTQLCTMTTAREIGLRPYRLEAACSRFGIPFDGAHHALADARASAALAQTILDLSNPEVTQLARESCRGMAAWPSVPIALHEGINRPILAPPPSKAPTAKAESRVAHADVKLQEVSAAMSIHPTAREEYLATVDAVIEDRMLTTDEEDALVECAVRNGLNRSDLGDLHLAYLQELAGGMWADETIDSHELADLKAVAKLLLIPDSQLEWAIRHPTNAGPARAASLAAGDRVVFTGEMAIDRADWKRRAQATGLKVTGSVSGLTDWLVIPITDPGTRKGRDAADKGVRVVSEQQFIRMIGALEQSQTGSTAAHSHSP
ncbi:MAG: exonuclease domain-containing protein [Candidatus Nanopelagicales bacterium]